MYSYFLIKRLLDILTAAVLLIFLFPLLVVLAGAVYVEHGEVFFLQKRIGLNGKPFFIIKFKTLRVANDVEAASRLGAFMRTYSLDEWPQLVNVLKGEMSLVGPRPLLPEYLPFYKRDELKRHSVRPGMTGLAQVMGRNHISWDEKFQRDLEYINRRSILLDIHIILKSFLLMFKKARHLHLEPLTAVRTKSL